MLKLSAGSLNVGMQSQHCLVLGLVQVQAESSWITYSVKGMNLTCGNVKTQDGTCIAALTNRMLASSVKVCYFQLVVLFCKYRNFACEWMWKNSDKVIIYHCVHIPVC